MSAWDLGCLVSAQSPAHIPFLISTDSAPPGPTGPGTQPRHPATAHRTATRPAPAPPVIPAEGSPGVSGPPHPFHTCARQLSEGRVPAREDAGPWVLSGTWCPTALSHQNQSRSPALHLNKRLHPAPRAPWPQSPESFENNIPWPSLRADPAGRLEQRGGNQCEGEP